MTGRLLIVGHSDPTHVGSHLLRAAATLGVSATICDAADAYDGSAWSRRANWWLRGRLPARLSEFSNTVVDQVRSLRPDILLTTGIAPVSAAALKQLAALPVRLANFLTDDPWNPAQRAPWFFAALPHYHHVFSPRQANIPDLRTIAGPAIHRLAFAYDPAVHFSEPLQSRDERDRYDADVVIVGGGDRDRVRTVTPLIESGLRVALYGGYWDRYRATAESARGLVDGAGVRRAVAGAAVSLCLVRRSNRDGHSMRSFEVPAMGGCMLVEDTAEHREMFGADGDAVVYFGSPTEAVDLARMLVGDPERRRTLAARAHALIAAGRHTYADRLATILAVVEGTSLADSQPISMARESLAGHGH